jgi:vancomycin permeability regulator SanA
MDRFRRLLKTLLVIAVIGGVVGAVVLLILNGVVMAPGKERILSLDEAAALTEVDCILVLGCQVKPDGEPSHMLHDRVMQGVDLYDRQASPVLFMTGDSRRENYDETGTMKALAVASGVPSEAVVTDPYGLSTYDSILRAKEVYGYDKILIVTQEYHLYRAIYIAVQNGIDAYGVASDPRPYAGQIFREAREVAARAKDFLFCLLNPAPEMAYTLPDGHPVKKVT